MAKFALNVIAACGTAAVGFAFAQTTPSANPAQTVVRAGVIAPTLSNAPSSIGFAGVFPASSMTGHPYSAEQVTEHEQTLADGTHIQQTTMRVKMYRDSQGRTRTERSFTPPSGANTVTMPPIVDINDSEGNHYMLDQQRHIARRFSLARPTQALTRVANPSGQSSQAAFTVGLPPQNRKVAGNQWYVPASSVPGGVPNRPNMKSESLGTQTIEGISAEGTRTTMTLPEGAVGNDRPIVTTTETWVSPELKVMVLSKTSDPRSGESTTKLVNISQAEPDASLFQVPEGYSVVDGNHDQGLPIDTRH